MFKKTDSNENESNFSLKCQGWSISTFIKMRLMLQQTRLNGSFCKVLQKTSAPST